MFFGKAPQQFFLMQLEPEPGVDSRQIGNVKEELILALAQKLQQICSHVFSKKILCVKPPQGFLRA